MNKNKILLGLLSIPVFVIPVMASSIIQANALDVTSNRLSLDYSSTIGGRPKFGTVKYNQIAPKNPNFPTAWAFVKVDGDTQSDGLNYVMQGGMKVRSTIKKGYGYELLYYEPYANSNGTPYKSPQADGVRENLYTSMYSMISNSTPNYNHYVWRSWELSDWKGSETNFSKYSIKPNYGQKYYLASSADSASNSVLSSNINSKGEATSTLDQRFNKYGEWRYIGYNMLGEALNNSFFPTDGDNVSAHKSDQGLLYQSINNRDFKKYKQFGIISGYDKGVFVDYKLKAIEKLIESDKGFKDGTVYYVDANGTKKEYSRGTIGTDTWMNILSCSSNPILESPKFNTYRVQDGVKTNINESKLWSVNILAPTDPKLTADLYISKMTVYSESGKFIAEFTRDAKGAFKIPSANSIEKLVAGSKYKVDYTIQNTSSNVVRLSPTEINAGFSINQNAGSADENTGFNGNKEKWNATSSTTVIPAKGSVTINSDFVVPMDTENAFKINGLIPSQYGDYNADETNDWSYIIFGIKDGDIGVSSIKMYDINNKEVAYMIPGEEYNIEYTVKYNGPSVKFQDYYYKYYWCSHTDPNQSHWGTEKVYYDKYYDFSFSWTAKRWLQGGQTELYTKSKVESLKEITNGKTWVFETGYQVYESPKAEATISFETPNNVVDNNNSNNNGSNSWNYDYDVKVENVTIFNKDERPNENGEITLGIKYDIDVIAPSGAPYFEVDTKTKITLGDGKVIEFTDHVGKGSNKDITREVTYNTNKIESANGSKTLTAKVFANYDKKIWETDLTTGQSNNQKDATTTQLAPINPKTAKGCALDKTTNSWTVSHQINNYTGLAKEYNSFNGYNRYGYNKYGNYNKYSKTTTYNESYNINYIKFKSKDTIDNKYGNNGWVDLLKSSEKNKAIIKAGYGYELEIEVAYKTNAFQSQLAIKQATSNGRITGTTVTKLNTPANIYKDIYVKTPDDLVLSATGMYGTKQAFDIEVVESNNSTTVLRYKMKTTTQNGVSVPLKIYTDEASTDGAKTFKVWTPTITGVGYASKNINLCDNEDVSYIIDGSMYDDNQDNIIQ